jgi:hypothetical protein
MLLKYAQNNFGKNVKMRNKARGTWKNFRVTLMGDLMGWRCEKNSRVSLIRWSPMEGRRGLGFFT